MNGFLLYTGRIKECLLFAICGGVWFPAYGLIGFIVSYRTPVMLQSETNIVVGRSCRVQLNVTYDAAKGGLGFKSAHAKIVLALYSRHLG